MKKIGITGGIACGKSTVSQLLREKGYLVIDADEAARKVVKKDRSALAEIVAAFGKEMLLQNGELNRAALATLIFRDEEKRQQLNQITHPKIRDWLMAEMEKSNEEVVFFDIPLLFESQAFQFVDCTVVVTVDEETQLKRLMARNQLSQEEALARIDSQMPLTEQVKLADYVIDNSGTKAQTKQQLEKVLQQILG